MLLKLKDMSYLNIMVQCTGTAPWNQGILLYDFSPPGIKALLEYSNEKRSKSYKFLGPRKMLDFSTALQDIRKQWHKVFRILKEKKIFKESYT